VQKPNHNRKLFVRSAVFGGAGKLVDESGHCLVGSLVFSAINNIFVKYEEHDEEAAKSFAADRVSSFIIGLLIILTPVFLFADWRYSVLFSLIIRNQSVFRRGLRDVDTGIQMWLSIGAITIYMYHFFLTW